MTRPVFGVDLYCHRCHGARCAFCGWSGFEPRAVARHTDPETSHEAARSIPSESIRQSQALILELLKEHGPMTDERVYRFHRVTSAMSPSGARTRRAELVALGKVFDSGRRETVASGRKSIVWAARNG